MTERRIHSPAPRPARAGWRWHAAAVLVFTLATPLVMRGWLDATRLPDGDFAGFAGEVEAVRKRLVRHGRLPVWDPERFAGTTHFISSIKEVAAFPLAQAFGAVAGTKLMFGVLKVVSALGMYLVFARCLGAPGAGIVAGGAYAFGSVASHQTAQGGHLDIATSLAILPFVVLAAVGMLRGRSWPAAAALGVLVGMEFAAHSYVQAMLCPVIVLVVLAFRPWRQGPGDDDPLADRGLARRWGVLVAGAVGVFLLFAGSQLAWLAADLRNHQLFGPGTIAFGLERYVEHSPFLFVNRGDWLGPWLQGHRPPWLPLDPADPLFNERRYLGLVAIAVCGTGWFAARRHHALRRWYQTFAVLFLVQYWLSIGPRTLLWQLGRTFHWPEAADGPLWAAATVAAAGSAVWALRCRRRARAGASIAPARVELGLGLALVLLFLSQSLFGLLRTVLPVLRGMRSPGHFFDLAPLSFYALFGVAVVSLGRAIRAQRLRRALAGALVALLVVDFWPSTAAYFRGTPLEPFGQIARVLARLPGEDGTLRLATFPWVYSTHASLLAAPAPAGAAWSFLEWQAGREWRGYMRAAMGDVNPWLEDGERARARAVADALARLGRLSYAVEDFERVARLRFEAPWRPVAEAGTLAVWERAEVAPMAAGYRDYVLQVGGSDAVEANAITEAFVRNLLLVSGGKRLAAVDEDVVRGAALVRLDGRAALAGPLAERDRDRVIEVRDAAALDRLAARLAALPREPLVPVGYARPAPEHIRLEVDAGRAPAVVFVSESHHPWWRATVDGRPVRVLRAARAFMAVAVEPGRHVIDLRLRRPALVAAADWTTAAAWIALALAASVGAVAAWRRRRRA